jgi:hypothetical protein
VISARPVSTSFEYPFGWAGPSPLRHTPSVPRTSSPRVRAPSQCSAEVTGSVVGSPGEKVLREGEDLVDDGDLRAREVGADAVAAGPGLLQGRSVEETSCTSRGTGGGAASPTGARTHGQEDICGT